MPVPFAFLSHFSLGGCRCYFCGNYSGCSSGCSRQERHPPVYLQHLRFRPRRIYSVGQASQDWNGKAPEWTRAPWVMIIICDLLTGACLKTFLLSHHSLPLFCCLGWDSNPGPYASDPVPLSYGLHGLLQNTFYEDILYIYMYIYHWFISYVLLPQ